MAELPSFAAGDLPYTPPPEPVQESNNAVLKKALGGMNLGGFDPEAYGTLIQRKTEAAGDVAKAEQEQKRIAAQGEYEARKTYGDTVRKQYEAAKPTLMAPPPKFNVTKDTEQGLTGLAALMTIGGMIIGSKGAMSGVNAMNAMTGVLKGYQEGNQQRIDFETKKYEQSIKDWERTLQQTKDSLEQYQKLAAVDLSTATAKAAADAAAKGQEVIAAKIKQEGISQTIAMVDKLIQQTSTSRLHSVVDKETGQQTYATEAEIRNNPNKYYQAPSGAGSMSKIGQSVSGIVEQMTPDAQEAAKRSITQYGLSANDQKLIPANWASIKEADDVSRYIDEHPNAVGPLAQIAGKGGEFGKALLDNIKNAFGISTEAGIKAGAAAIAETDRKLDAYAAANPSKADDVQAAKVLSKRLFSLALQDAVAVGRPTVFLEKSLSSFYSPTVRVDTLKELIRTRAEEAENRLPPIFQTKNSKTPFKILQDVSTAPKSKETRELSSEDKAALEWANANPSDPRSSTIKKRLGVE